MKIAFYSHIILEVGGGLEKYFVETSRQLTERYPDLEIDIITHDDKFAIKLRPLMSLIFMRRMTVKELYREPLESITAKLGPKVKYHKVGSIKELRQRFSEYDAVYSKNEIIESVILKFFVGYRNVPKPLIFGCHTPINYPMTGSVYARVHNFLYQGFIYRFLASGVSTFHALNSGDEGILKKVFPRKQVVKIPNPFDFDAFVAKAAQYPFDGGIDLAKFNILWMGRLAEQKGVDDLVKLVDVINATPAGSGVAWNIAGDGPDRHKLDALGRRWQNVHHFGHIDNDQIASLCSQNNLFVSTSKWEGFPYTLLEAQSFGLPVVAYDIQGCNDIVVDGQTGKLEHDLEALCSAVSRLQDKTVNVLNPENIKVSIRSKFGAKMTYDELYRLLSSA